MTLMDTAAVSAWLGVPERTLDQWAYLRKGPPFAKVGRFRRYDPAKVAAWIEANTRGGDAA